MRIQALQEGVPGLWAHGRAPPSPPFPMANRSSSFLPFLIMRLVWSFGVCPTLNFSIASYCLLVCLKSCLSSSPSSCYYRVRSPWAAQTPSLVNLSDFWRPFLYSSAPKLVLYMVITPTQKLQEVERGVGMLFLQNTGEGRRSWGTKTNQNNVWSSVRISSFTSRPFTKSGRVVWLSLYLGTEYLFSKPRRRAGGPITR